MRYGRSDANQPAIVAALRRLGCSVLILKDLGDGKPDIAVALAGRTVLFEIKNPKRRNWDRKKNTAQLAFRETWRGECYVVYTIDEALAIMLG